MFDEWCEIEETEHNNRKTRFSLTERIDGRDAIQDDLAECIRSHYDDLDHIADDIKELGFPGAAAVLHERLPRTARARSGDMGEILATEFVEFQTDLCIPVRRLRYKDGREMALRGVDFLGIDRDENDRLVFLKGEAKSGRRVTPAVIDQARTALSDEDGRPTPISLLFIADRLLESDDDGDVELGREIRNEVALKTVPARRITHGLFILSGNAPLDDLDDDLVAADEAHKHVSACLHVEDHGPFIAAIYEEAGNLGDD